MKRQVGTKLGSSRDQVEIKSDYAREKEKILTFCQEPKTIGEIMNAMNWKNRTKFRRKYIHPLLEKGILEMTIPDKPNSSKQKYCSKTSS